VGVAAQLPSGDFSPNDLGYRTFWDFLVAKGQAYQPLSSDLFTSSEFRSLQERLKLPAKGAFLKNYDGMDSISFGISMKDARIMPFTARRLMELSFEALADSGVDYRRQKVGCFMTGPSSFEGAVSTDGSFASLPSALANRISYTMDITGPSVQLDTACSSSLTGLHLAIQAIEAGDCHTALVGAAQINRELAEWKNYSLGGILSSDGITKPFDADADGFGRGEGIAVVVIKSLDDALRDNDHIYSVILGSFINSTGSLMPLHVPSTVAQKECIRGAYARAGKNTSDADFAELHITGTSVGDRIEATAVGEVFTENLDIGSAKGNIGHLEAAAFLASLLKACLILENRLVPPTVNLSVLSPTIQWNRYRLGVPTELKPLRCNSDSGRSIISLSGAGIGGSTGHVVIESPPSKDHQHAQPPHSVAITFVVGGLSPKAVIQISRRICEELPSTTETLRACAVTMSRRARQLPWRTYFTLGSCASFEIAAATLVPTSPPPIAFIFSGQGPQNLNMGRGLFSVFPVFRSTILELDEVYKRLMGESLLGSTGLFATSTAPPPLSLSPTAWPVTITVAAIAMLQMALFDLTVSCGIVPSSFAGHSAGETAILYASGAGSKAMALEIAIARGQAMAVTESIDSGMASLACGADVAKEIISEISSNIEISCFNSPESIAISGSADLLAQAISLAQARGIFAQRIRTMVPGHCSYMDKIKADYMARMTDIFTRYPGPHIPNVPVFSTCTAQRLVNEFSPSYFWDNCRNPVLFSAAISGLLDFHRDGDASSNPIFLEVSCHPVLSSSIYPHNVSEKSVLCPMRRFTSGEESIRDEATLFTETLARITLHGYNSCDFSGLYGPSDYRQPFMDHPWVYRPIVSPLVQFSEVKPTHKVNGPLSTSLSTKLNEHTHPLLAQHVINGEPILPATGFIEILLEAGANVLWDVEFVSFFSMSAKHSPEFILERSGCGWSLISIKHGSTTLAECLPQIAKEHARGLMDSRMPMQLPEPLILQSIWDRLPKLEMKGFYESLRPFAAFGPAYWRVVRCHGNAAEIIAQIRGPSPDELETECRLDPISLDACLHILLHPAISKSYGAESMYLPFSLGRFTHHSRGSVTGNWFSHIRRRGWSPGLLSISDCWFAFEDGRTHCTMSPRAWMNMLQDLGCVNGHASIDGGHSFLFTAQKPDVSEQSVILHDVLGTKRFHVVQYSFGKETEFRARLGTMARNDHLQLNVVALEGRDADSAMGLCAVLAREFPFWTIHLAIFECPIHVSQPLQVMAQHGHLFERGEHVVYFPREGSPRVLRAVPSRPPATISDQHPLVLGDSDHLIINLISFQATAASVYGFVGRVAASYNPSYTPGDMVVGITEQKKTSTLVVHLGCIASLGLDHPPHPADVLKVAVTTLIQNYLSKRGGPIHSRIRVLVATMDEFMSGILTSNFQNTGIPVKCDFMVDDPSRSVDVLITDSDTNSRYPHLRHWVQRSGRFLLWDNILCENIAGRTWEIAHALELGLPELVSASSLRCRHPHQEMPVLPQNTSYSPLFHHNKSYILLGGIGGLGVDLAVWMYQHGARHIILTSRRGIVSLDPEKDVEALSKIAYLQSCNQLELQLVKSDATDESALSLLINSLRLPIGGCFQLTMVLSDRLFLNQSQHTFAAPHDAKLKVFEVFAAAVDVNSLDFYVAFSSLSGLLGLAGQSNYASACTVLEGVLARYPCAFSLVLPAIRDAGYLVFRSYPAADLWNCLEDGLRKIRDGPSFSRYIPDLDWDLLHARYSLPLAFHHLLSSHRQSTQVKVKDSKGEMDVLQMVLSVLEVEKKDFDFNRSLLSYGLDSLSATRLSAALQPFVQVSQVQLLAGISWSELYHNLRQTGGGDRELVAPKPATVAMHPAMNRSISALPAQTIVEICDGPGIPLIVFPGATGRIEPLLALRGHITGALYGIQVTKSTPITPFMAHAAFVVQKIREKWSTGPYRLGAFSVDSVIAVAVAKLLEESGQEIIQLAFIDGFPLLWTEKETELSLRTQELPTLLNWAVVTIIDLLRHDPLYGPESEQVSRWETALAVTPEATQTHLTTIELEAMRRLIPPLMQFLLEFYGPQPARSPSNFVGSFSRWVSSLKAPFSVFIAELGMIATLPDAARETWTDLGAHRCPSHKEVKRHFITGVGHYGILGAKDTAVLLQNF
ncbi:hypothetical protein GGX14DRAFT_367915, partial [Mycena pura]